LIDSIEVTKSLACIRNTKGRDLSIKHEVIILQNIRAEVISRQVGGLMGGC